VNELRNGAPLRADPCRDVPQPSMHLLELVQPLGQRLRRRTFWQRDSGDDSPLRAGGSLDLRQKLAGRLRVEAVRRLLQGAAEECTQSVDLVMRLDELPTQLVDRGVHVCESSSLEMVVQDVLDDLEAADVDVSIGLPQCNSSNPVALGTTHREPGPLGICDGTVTGFERPTKITFHPPMTVKLRAGVVDVTVRYTLTSQGETTHVRRVVTLGIPWSLRLVQPLVVRAFRVESGRTLLALEAYADKLPSAE
jgi:hypothetical protein